MRWMTVAIGIVVMLSAAGTARSQQKDTPVKPLPHGTQLPRPMRIRVGGNVEASKLISQVPPIYPPAAIAAHISGTVTLHAIVGTDGKIRELNVVSGPAELTQSAIDAVKQWRYQKTLLNGQPIEVDTTILVVYTLSGTPQHESPRVDTGKTVVELVPNTGPPINPQLRADILKLMDAMQVRGTGEATFEKMYQTIRPIILRTLPETPNREKIADEYGRKLEALLNSPDFTEPLVQIYASSLSDDDVKALTAFYTTPAGQHYLAAVPQIASETNRIAMRIAAEHMMEILKGLCEDYPELKGKAGFCPAKGKEKRSQLKDMTGSRLGD